jgi:TolB-like protein/Tfp pilus assembly protein PilF
MKIDNFFSELKRRNVYKIAVAYAIVAWLLIQAASIVLPTFEAPAWTMKVLIAALTVGFPIAILFAWAFEITPEGIKLEKDVDPAQSITRQTGRKLIGTTIALALLAAGLFVYRMVGIPQGREAVRSEDTAEGGHRSAASLPISQKSIAVLPFENLSRDPDNAYFVDGTQNEILTRLSKISALKVISRTSTTRYTSHPDNLRQIARELGVANILEGSVQRAEGAVRVNVQLIEAETDSHLWAETYDRDIKNIFSVESEIAQNVADALRAKLLPEESSRVASVPTKNPEAYDLFLKAEYFGNQILSANAKDPVGIVRQAADLYERAVAADPGFALAYARLSYLRARAYWYNFDPRPEAIEAADKAARRALHLQPELGEAHLAMGYVHYWGHRNDESALAEFGQAGKSLPNNLNVLTATGFVHRRQGKMEQALHELEQAAALDPRDNLLPREIGSTLVYMRRYAEAEPAYRQALTLVPEDFETHVNRVTALLMNGDLEAASKALAAIPAGSDPEGTVSFTRWQLALAMHQPDQALAALEHAPDWLLDTWPSTREPVTLLRAQALMQKGEAAAARAEFLKSQRVLEGLLRNPRAEADAQGCLALVHAGLGEKKAALEAGRRATEALPVSRDIIIGSCYLAQLAMAEAQVGEKESAISHIEELLAIPVGHVLSVASLRLDPRWDPLRSDPRFQKLCEEKPK